MPSTSISILPAGSKPADFPCLSPGTPKTIISDVEKAIAASRSSLLTDEYARNAKETGELADNIHLSSLEASEYTISEEQAAWNNKVDDDDFFEEDNGEEEDYVFEMMRHRLVALKRA